MSEIDPWVLKLKAAYDAGYYRTEAASDSQIPFPWQDKRCRDCPFWLNGVCRVRAVPRAPEAHTCGHYEPANHAEAKRVIEDRMEAVRRLWWKRLGNA